MEVGGIPIYLLVLRYRSRLLQQNAIIEGWPSPL